MPWLTGAFLPDFAPEWAGWYLIALQKPTGGIRGIVPVDAFRRAAGNAIGQAVQPMATKVCIETYPNLKQFALSKDGASHFLYFLNAAYYDPAFTSAEDAEDPTVIVNLDISNAFGSLCARLVLDVLAGKASRDYARGINIGRRSSKEIAQTLWRCEGTPSAAGHIKNKQTLTPTSPTAGRKFPDTNGLAYADDGNIIATLSKALKLIAVLKSVFKIDGNLDFNIGKTKILAKGPTARHVFNRANRFLDNDPDLQEIANDFTLDMLKDEGIEVLGAPVGIDRYIKTHVAQNCLRIMADFAKHEPLDDGLVHFQLLKYCMHTCTQYISANVTIPSPEHFLSLQHKHVGRTLANAILRKGTRGLYQHWSPHDIDFATAMIQMPHGMGGYGMTPNAIAQISAKVAIASRFLGIVGSLPPSEQTIWLPHQNVQDPST